MTTGYNDFAHFTWLGNATGTTPLFDTAHVGQWYCIEPHMKLNDAGQSNGILEFWINGSLEAQRTGLNFLGSYNAFGINAVFFENFWNNSSPVTQERYWDRIVWGRSGSAAVRETQTERPGSPRAVVSARFPYRLTAAIPPAA